MSFHYDIVIVGGGLVGASFAAKILQQNSALCLALIDNITQKNNLNIDFNARAIALSYKSLQCLRSLGIFEKLAAHAEAIKEVHVSSKGQFGVSQLKAQDAGLSSLGAVLNADVLQHCLDKHIEEKLKIFRPAYIVKMQQEDRTWELHLNTGDILSAGLLVAADGTQSFVRQTLGIETTIHDYHQSAINVNIELSQAHDNIAYERFTETGCIAMLPFGEKRVKCVWVLPNTMIDAYLQQSETEFLQALQNVFGFRLGRLKQVGKRVVYPLKSLQSQALYAHRCVFLGNAANTLHPVGAQGFNLGLRDAFVLSDLLIEAVLKGQDPGSQTLLKAYANARQSDHQRTRYFTDNLAESNFAPILGILACEFLPFAKKWLMAQGLGRLTPVFI